MHKSFAFVSIMLVLGACSSSNVDDNSDDTEFSEMPWKSNSNLHLTNNTNLVDHGGKIVPVSRTYAIWWGNPGAFPSDAQDGLTSLFQGFAGSTWLNIESQYMRGANVASLWHTNWTDTSSPPANPPKVSTIVNKACNTLRANSQTPDPNGIYFVYASNFPHVNYCAWHSHGWCNGVDIQVAYMPNVTGIPGCDPGNLYGCNAWSQGTRALANVTSHEFSEAITDADLTAWYDSSGAENGDKCAWRFSSCLNLSNGSNWQLQQEWSNNAGGCVQQ